MNMLRNILAACIVLILSLSVHADTDFFKSTLVGSFEGPLVIGRDDMQLAFTFAGQGDDFTARMTSGGMGVYGMPVDTVIVDERNITIRISRLDLEFTGTLRLDEANAKVVRIDGDWFQYSEMVPVTLLPVDEPSF